MGEGLFRRRWDRQVHRQMGVRGEEPSIPGLALGPVHSRWGSTAEFEEGWGDWICIDGPCFQGWCVGIECVEERGGRGATGGCSGFPGERGARKGRDTGEPNRVPGVALSILLLIALHLDALSVRGVQRCFCRGTRCARPQWSPQPGPHHSFRLAVTCWEVQVLEPHPHLLSQKPWLWASVISVLANPTPEATDLSSHGRTTGLAMGCLLQPGHWVTWLHLYPPTRHINGQMQLKKPLSIPFLLWSSFPPVKQG